MTVKKMKALLTINGLLLFLLGSGVPVENWRFAFHEKPCMAYAKMRLKVGDQAPDFSLPSDSGTVRLQDFKGKKAVVLYFYPKDDTPGCTAEACSFRDSFQVFQEAGAEVIGVSADSQQSHKAFKAKHHLPFILLSDQKNEVRKLYDVPSTLGILPGRVTYVISKDGTLLHIFSSQLNAKKHVEEALKIIWTKN